MIKSMKGLLDDLNQVDFTLSDNIGLSEKETFGIEIEFDNVDLNNIKKFQKWSLKPDTSITIDNIGGELISPILIDNPDTWKDIEKKCEYLISKKAVATRKTGAHIHIGSQILDGDPSNIRKFLKLWELFENTIFYFSFGKDIAARPSLEKHARPISGELYRIRNSKHGYDDYKTYYDWYQFFQKQKFNKHAGINFKNYKGIDKDQKNTIEIRCPNGTLDAKIWQNNIQFFTKLMLKVTESDFDEEVVDYYLSKKDYAEYMNPSVNFMDIEKAQILADFVYDNEKDKLLFLKQYIKLFDKEKTHVKTK